MKRRLNFSNRHFSSFICLDIFSLLKHSNDALIHRLVKQMASNDDHLVDDREATEIKFEYLR